MSDSSKEEVKPTETAAKEKTPSASERGFPVACLVVGMAGSGKSTLMQRLAMHLRSKARRAARAEMPKTGMDPEAKKKAERMAAAAALYCVNLDPAVSQCAFGPNVDIRDTVKYKEVMEHYRLGPNGAIMTSLNLFATKFDQVVALLQKRCPPESQKSLLHEDSTEPSGTAAKASEPCKLKHVLVDTPGQIEAFTWSASGALYTESFASLMPTVIIYVVDVPRSAQNPSTFMANMLYACSILYRTRLPIVLALTKTDIVSEKIIIDWMHDFDVFAEALDADPTFAHDLARSMALFLQEFYAGLQTVGVSAVTGNGTDDLLEAVDNASRDYYSVYLADLHERERREHEKEQRRQKRNIERIERDLAEGEGGDPMIVGNNKKKDDDNDDDDE